MGGQKGVSILIRYVSALLAALISTGTFANAQMLQGGIAADPAHGLLNGRLCISGAAVAGSNAFLLNRGLNIREVRIPSSDEPLNVQLDMVGGTPDAAKYRLPEPLTAAGFCVEYLGAFPVYNVDQGQRAACDWKGQIAFNGQSVRAAEQSRFYPVPINPAGAELDMMSYAVTIACRDCTSIFLNGSPPKAGPLASFASPLPRALLLYAGHFYYSSVGGANFVGGATAADAQAISAGIRQIASHHSTYLRVPYADVPSFLTFASVGRKRRPDRNSWAFVTWPTIAMDGRISFSSLLSADGRGLDPARQHFLAHEMAHYYFLTRYFPTGPLRWFLLESTAEFMALKFLRAARGEEAFTAALNQHRKSVQNHPEFTPLDQIADAEQMDGVYRYGLGSLLLFALERHLGAETLRKALASFIQSRPSTPIGYREFRERLLTAGATERQIEAFATECLHSRPPLPCIGSGSAT